MSRWTDAKKAIADLPENNPFKKTLILLYELIRYTYDSIPEVE